MVAGDLTARARKLQLPLTHLPNEGSVMLHAGAYVVDDKPGQPTPHHALLKVRVLDNVQRRTVAKRKLFVSGAT